MNKEWNYKEFNDIFNWCSKSNIGSRSGKNIGTYKLYIASASEIKYYDEYLEDTEALIFGTGGNPCVHYENGKFAYTNHCEAATKKNEYMCIKFYYYYFQKDRYFDLQSTFVGGGIKNSSKKRIGKLLVPVPPIEVQQEIVTKIENLFSKLDKGIEELRKIKEQLKLYRQAILKEYFTPNKNWYYGTFGEVIDVLTDYHANGSYKKLKENVKLLDTPNYAVMVRSTNFEKNDFKNDLKYIDKNSYEFLKKSQLFGGEILIGKIGNAGKVYFTKDLGCPMSLAMNMFAIRLISKIYNKYAYYYLLSPMSVADMRTYIKGVGTPTIDKKSIRSLRFNYPEYEKQIKIVSHIEQKLSVCDKIEQTIDEALQKSENLRQSILKQAFEGKLV